VAAGVSVLAAGLSLLLAPLLEPRDFALFLGAVMLSAWYGGLGPGLFSVVISAVAGVSLALATTGLPDPRLSSVGPGYTNQQIADRLGLSVKTVETYRARLVQKLGLRSRAELLRYAMDTGLFGRRDAGPEKASP
jgi:membrane protein implicated in regulation of membrane protease activity